MSAIVQVQLTITAKPETRSKKYLTTHVFATAKQRDDTQVWELFAFETMRAEISRLRPRDLVVAQGALAVRVEYGVPICAINVAACTALRLPTPPKAKKKGHGTRLANPAGVAAANAEFARKHGVSV